MNGTSLSRHSPFFMATLNHQTVSLSNRAKCSVEVEPSPPPLISGPLASCEWLMADG